MNRSEYKALFADQSIKCIERSLYLYLRHHMDYDSGVVGKTRKISYQGIAENLEFIPDIGSTEPSFKPSRDQIKRLLNKIIRRGWVEPLHNKNNTGPVRMIFRLVLASADSVRPHEERQRSATGAPQQMPHSARVLQFPEGSNQVHERHTSDLSDKEDIYNARELCLKVDLKYEGQFCDIPSIVGLVLEKEELNDLFNVFRNSVKDMNINRSVSEWLGYWRQYCASVKANQSRNQKSSQGGSNGVRSHGDRKPNASAETIRRSIKRAQSGIGTNFDEIDEDT